MTFRRTSIRLNQVAFRTTALLTALMLLIQPSVAHADPLITLSNGINWAATTPTDSWVETPLDDAFYTPPADFHTSHPNPGDVIRTQPAPHLLNTFGPDFPGYAQKILYTSTDEKGSPVAVSGYIIEPTVPWSGPGPTPTIVFAPGTRGQADICAPSRGTWLLSSIAPTTGAFSINYELPLQYFAAQQGIRVVITDYIGLGTPGVHTYINAIEQSHAVLDAARAAIKAMGVPADTPIGFHGYSQGGGAAAAAAENAANYAPELNVKGTYAGAPPANLEEVFNAVDGSTISGVLGMSINGFAARDDEVRHILDRYLSDYGREFLATVATSCVPDSAAHYAFVSSEKFTVDGTDLATVVSKEPELQATLKKHRIGLKRPNAPIMVATSIADDIIPTGQAKQLAQDFCALGSAVEFHETHLPRVTPDVASGLNHALQLFGDAPASISYLIDRFNDRPAPTNCGAL